LALTGVNIGCPRRWQIGTLAFATRAGKAAMGQLDGGRLSIRARFAGGRIAGIEVRLQRPRVAHLFAGHAPAAVCRSVPLLFSLCALAQQAAAAGALAAAGDGPAPVPEAGALWTECLHEHLWRLLLDWPRALGVPPAAAEFAAWRRTRGSPGFVAASVETVEAALAGVIARCRFRLGAAGPAEMPVAGLAPADWLECFGTGAALPPPLYPTSVTAAYAQRVAALLGALAGLQGGADYPLARAAGVPGSGIGVGQALTARGVLTHAARVADGKVAAYHVWAPTDRHFADAQGLAGLLADTAWPDAGAARRRLELAILALDPCLPYDLEVADA
jgi:hypothetical protein